MLDPFQKLIANSGLSDKVLNTVLSHFKKITVRKNTIILSVGQMSQYWYFIDKGLVHSFIESDNGPETTWLVAEGEFIASAESFFMQQPSLETIETLEDCTLWRISHNDLRALQMTFPEVQLLSIKLTERQVVEYGQRVRLLKTHPAKKRYELFYKNFPHLRMRARIDYLASYLGLSRTTFLHEQSACAKKPKNSPISDSYFRFCAVTFVTTNLPCC
jgi:CRP/FNR family transcriptional regulator, anaerobic regulatory protein